jgi:hypothetical protein
VLHDHSKTDPAKSNGWSISRYKYFFYAFVGSFVWYWFPGYSKFPNIKTLDRVEPNLPIVAQFLSVFAFVTWIKPKNDVINQLFGGGLVSP